MAESDVSVAVVTATHDRAHLLPRLYESLARQTDLDFQWVVVDDASADDTQSVLRGLQRSASFGVHVVPLSDNIGKSASLNRAFDAQHADYYLIIDSDDFLTADAIELVRRAVARDQSEPKIGGHFFRYRRQVDNELLGGELDYDEVVTTRAVHDRRFGKYDGAVGYFARVTDHYRYPEFPPETYVGPTVLQLAMADRFTIRFTTTVIGVAEYQTGGISAQGRRLRLANPRGMMEYCRLRHAQSRGLSERLRNSSMFYAYSLQVGPGCSSQQPPQSGFEGCAAKVLGRAMWVIWKLQARRTRNPVAFR